jgi:hypothetical protein
VVISETEMIPEHVYTKYICCCQYYALRHSCVTAALIAGSFATTTGKDI